MTKAFKVSNSVVLLLGLIFYSRTLFKCICILDCHEKKHCIIEQYIHSIIYLYQAQKRIKSFSNLFLKKKQSFSDQIIILYSILLLGNIICSKSYFDLHLNCRLLYRKGRFHNSTLICLELAKS